MPDARTARWLDQARARRTTRRAVWRLADGDPDQYRALMQARPAPRYISYDDDAGPTRTPASVIWLDCLRQALRWTAFYAFWAALIVLAGAVGYL